MLNFTRMDNIYVSTVDRGAIKWDLDRPSNNLYEEEIPVIKQLKLNLQKINQEHTVKLKASEMQKAALKDIPLKKIMRTDNKDILPLFEIECLRSKKNHSKQRYTTMPSPRTSRGNEPNVFASYLKGYKAVF